MSEKYNKYINFLTQKSKGLVLIFSLLISSVAISNPVVNNIGAGQVSIQQSGSTTTVNQTSQRGIINWKSFNIGAGEHTHFQQPVGGSTLNRISAQQGASQIYGRLTSTGQIILINSAGIYFGPSAYVNVGSLIATTADIRDQDYLNGNYHFSQPSPYSGSIVNEGQIIARDHGLVALVGAGVDNKGMIQANLGSVVLGAGETFTVDLSGDKLINFSIDSKTSRTPVDKDGRPLSDGVRNTGSLIADGGKVLVSAKAAKGVLDNVINIKGIVQARSVSQSNGEIIFSGDPDSGVVRVAAKIDASGKGVNQKGGNVVITGNQIMLESSTEVDVSGDVGGGNVNIGGSYQGKGPLVNAKDTIIQSGVNIYADAIRAGNAGQVIVWSDNQTKFFGNIYARGGALSGDGGLVETSGKNTLVANGFVTTMAANGKTGTWLLDPADITISTGGDSGYTDISNTFTPDSGASTSTINITTLQTALLTNNIIITTTNNGADGGSVGNITIANTLSWASANSLTLVAANNILINAAVTIGNAAGAQLILNATGTVTQGVGGTISGSGGVTANSGTVNFTLANSYTGGTIINAGATVIAGDAAALGSGGAAVLVNSGGTLSLNTSNINNTLTLNGSGVGGNGAVIGTGGLGGSITMASNTTFGGSGTITVNGSVGGAGDLIKVGSGSVLLNTNNTYTGNTVINGGTVRVQTDAGLGAVPGVATANNIQINGGTLNLLNIVSTSANRGITIGASGGTITTAGVSNINGDITGSGNITKTGNGELRFNGNNSGYTGNTFINTGALTLNNEFALGIAGGGTLTVASGASLFLGFFSNPLANTNTIFIEGVGNSGGVISGLNNTLSNNLVLTNNASLGGGVTYNGVISDGGNAYTLSNAGTGFIVIGGANTYTGGTIINGAAGTGITVTNASALGTVGSILINGGAALNLNLSGGTLANTNTITINSTGSLTSSGTGTNTFNNLVLLTGTAATFGTNAATSGLNIAGDISNTTANLTFNGTGTTTVAGVISGSGTLSKSGTGTLVLSNANTYTGATNVTAGTLRLSHVGAISSSNVNPITITTAGLDVNFNGTLLNTSAINFSGLSTFTYSGTSGQTATLNNPINILTSLTAINLSNANSTLVLTNVLSNAASIQVAGAGNVNFQGGLSGSGSLVKTGASTATLGSSTGYTGNITINSGTLAITSADSLGGVGTPGTLTMNAGSLDINIGNATLSNANAFSIFGGGIINVSGTSNAILSNAISGSLTTITTAAGASITLNGNITTSVTFGAGNATVNGVISGASSLIKNTSGTLLLNSANTYSGSTQINGGTLRYGINNALPTNNVLTVGTAAASVLDLNNFNATISSLSGNSLSSITLGSGTLTFGSGASTTFNGAITGAGNIIKVGNGTVTFSGSNDYQGTTTISAGTLQAGATNTFSANSAVILANTLGASLALNGFSNTIASLSGGGGTGGNVTLGAGTLTTGNANNTTYSGVMSGAGALVKQGTGTYTVSGNNTYTGATTVNAGILNATSATALGTIAGGTTVASGATLNLSAVAIGAEALTLNGTGVGATGALTSTGVSSYAGAVTLGSSTNINSSGTLTLSGAMNGSAALNLLGTGSIIFGNTLGAVTALGALSINNTATTFNGNVTAASLNSLTGTTTLNGSTITTTGAQLYQNTLTLNANSAMVASSVNIANGVGGNQSLSVTANTTQVSGTLGLNNLTVTGTSGTSSFALDTAALQTWQITGSNTGSFAATGIAGAGTFSTIASLTGGSGVDTFNFNNATSLTGSINGGAGANAVTYGYLTPVTVNLASSTATGMNGFSNISSFTGGSGSDTLIGNNGGSSWTLTGANTGTSDATSFGSFENLVGGNGNNTFVFNVGSSINSINGGSLSNINTLDFSALAATNIYLTNGIFVGNVETLGSTIVNFTNVNTVIGNVATDNFITLPSDKFYPVVYTSYRVGYIDDPLYFFNYLILGGISPVPPVPPTPPIPVGTSIPVSPILQVPLTGVPVLVIEGDDLDRTIRALWEVIDEKSRVKINPYCTG